MRPSIFIKFILLFSLFLILDFQLIAQSQGAPESMNYQAVIRDGSGNIVASQSVGIRIDILQGSASGTSVYQETFTTTTNAYGSIAIQIGTGTVVSGTFSTIDWGADLYFVETAVDISGGNTYSIISTTQFVSVLMHCTLKVVMHGQQILILILLIIKFQLEIYRVLTRLIR